LTLASPTLVESLIAPSAFRKLCCVDNPAILVHRPAVSTTERKKEKNIVALTARACRRRLTSLALHHPCCTSRKPSFLSTVSFPPILRHEAPKKRQRARSGDSYVLENPPYVSLLKSNSFCPSSDSLSSIATPRKTRPKEAGSNRIAPIRAWKSLKRPFCHPQKKGSEALRGKRKRKKPESKESNN
jgi:hypothetical protein